MQRHVQTRFFFLHTYSWQNEDNHDTQWLQYDIEGEPIIKKEVDLVLVCSLNFSCGRTFFANLKQLAVNENNLKYRYYVQATRLDTYQNSDT